MKKGKNRTRNKKKVERSIISLLFIIFIAVIFYFNGKIGTKAENVIENVARDNSITSYEIQNIPEYSGKAYVIINNNIPEFTDEDMDIKDDYYSDLKNGRVRKIYNKN